MKKLYILTLILIVCSCSRNSLKPEDQDPLRYKFPNYPNGKIGFFHSFFHDCGDSDYWRGLFLSKEFSANDTLFAIFSELVGLKGETPNFTKDEKAMITCSNGDRETFRFDLPYPKCMHQMQDVLLMYGALPSKKHDVEKYNGFLDLQEDRVQIVIHYKSYWTGTVVRDTAYVSPSK